MFKLLMILGCAIGIAAPAAVARGAEISGAGATFPAPLYAQWADAYQRDTGSAVDYQSVGSGEGIRRIKARTVDFGATDMPLTPDELDAAGLVQFPTVVGGVVPVINVPGVAPGQLRLTGAILGDIYRGVITRWNDPYIAAQNRRLKLPNLPINVVHRSDGSGTTFLFTTYLASKAPRWAARVGAGDTVAWPTGVGGEGNDGVAAYVRDTPGSIGYVEYAYAKQNHLTYALLRNKAGRFVAPTAQAFSAAARGARWSSAPGNYLLLLDQPGAASWPITGATFILMHRRQADAAQGREVLKFFDWAYSHGDTQAIALDYLPLPAGVKAQMRTLWIDQIRSGGIAVYDPQ